MWTDRDVRVTPSGLTEFTRSVCRAMGADQDVATEVATHLVDANLAGHDSHGVLRLSQYVAELDRGDLDPAARPHVIGRYGGTLLIDAHRGFGHFATRVAADLAAETAREHGIAVACVRHSGHIGRLGRYCELVTGAGLICLLTVGAAGTDVGAMLLPGMNSRFLAANPWALGVPAGEHAVVVDVSTTMVAEGKVTVAALADELLPEGCIVDSQGRPSRRADDYFAGGGLLPLGGLVAPHKGFGLGLGAALLGGLAMIGDARPTLAGSQQPPGSDRHGQLAGVCLVVIDPDAFGGREPYRASVIATTELLQRAEAAGAMLTVPGTPEWRSRQARTGGIPLPSPVITELRDISTRFDIPADLFT